MPWVLTAMVQLQLTVMTLQVLHIVHVSMYAQLPYSGILGWLLQCRILCVATDQEWGILQERVFFNLSLCHISIAKIEQVSVRSTVVLWERPEAECLSGFELKIYRTKSQTDMTRSFFVSNPNQHWYNITEDILPRDQRPASIEVWWWLLAIHSEQYDLHSHRNNV